jgi:hypothetical protein
VDGASLDSGVAAVLVRHSCHRALAVGIDTHRASSLFHVGRLRDILRPAGHPLHPAQEVKYPNASTTGASGPSLPSIGTEAPNRR